MAQRCDNVIGAGRGYFVPLIYNDPEHWRTRAKEARALAEAMTDPQGKAAMIEIAENYGRLAMRALERMSREASNS